MDEDDIPMKAGRMDGADLRPEVPNPAGERRGMMGGKGLRD